MSNEITKENIFRKPRYRTIIKLIIDYSDPELNVKLKFSHLKYILVKNSKFKNQEITKKNMENFFSTPSSFEKHKLEEIKNLVKKNIFPNSDYVSALKLLRENKRDELKELGYFSEDNKFHSDQALRDALTLLKKKGFIKYKKDKKFNYYIPSDDCLIYYWRWSTHHLIDNVVPDNPLLFAQIQGLILLLTNEFRND